MHEKLLKAPKHAEGTTAAVTMRPEIEPERYELHAGPAYRFDMNRRQFFKLLGGGIAVACISGGVAVDGADAAPTLPDEIGAWLHIGEDGRVTVYTGKVEVGQNIRTSLAQAVAEELRIEIAVVEIVMGDTDLTPFDAGTFGSRTTPQMAPQLRRAAAAAREVLVDLAAEALRVDRGALVVEGGMVSHPPSGRTAGFGELTGGRTMMRAIRDDLEIAPPAGTSAPKVGGRAFVTGAHQYVSDLRLPGMLIGRVLRPPSYGARLVAVDGRAAAAMDGVTFLHDGDFAAIAAPDAPTAARALSVLRAEWETSPQPSRAELFDHLKANQSDAGGWGGRSGEAAGDVAAGLSEAEHTVAATYTVDYIAHVPLEPRAAVAQWEDGRLTVWTGTQRPFGVRQELAEALRIPQEQVRVLMPDTGSAYGGKHTGEAAVEAARLARAAGRPVRLVWTREEEFTWAYFRPAGVIDVEAGVRADGTLTAWSLHNYNSGGAGIRTPYEVAHRETRFHPSRSPLRQGSYRALAATANTFARESHMDELARLAGMDPLAFRRKNLRDERLGAVLDAAAERFGWSSRERAAGRGAGIAGAYEKGGYVATCAEVAVDASSGQVRVVRIVQAFECGAIVNPRHLESQVVGCIVQGLGGALFERIDFAEGRIRNASLARYRVPRFSDLPEIEVVLLDRPDLPSAGAGETPILGIAPAAGNAIFEAVGLRLRNLPLAPNGVEV